jgi:hypothetical protein
MSTTPLVNSLKMNCTTPMAYDLSNSEMIVLIKGTLLFLLFLWLVNTPAQSQSVLHGKITDSKTQAAIPFVNLFFVNTLIGTSANTEGEYTFPKAAYGKYDLVISCLGYERKQITVDLSMPDKEVNIVLNPAVTQLKEVVVNSNDKEYKKQLKIFYRYFLGETMNANKCTIDNYYDLDFSFEGPTGLFVASSSKPLEITNNALGYRIIYLLDKFQIDFTNGYCTVSGIPRFENLKAKDDKQQSHWNKERDRAYFGSITHFMKSFRDSTLKENMYEISLLMPAGLKDSTEDIKIWLADSLYSVYNLTQRELSKKMMRTGLMLRVIYKDEGPEYNYKGYVQGSKQISFIKFPKRQFIIRENGYYENPLSFYIDGYWSWANKIAELMPLEYEPHKK